MSGDAESVLDGTFRGYRIPWWSFLMNETPVAGREQSITDDASFSLFMSTTF